MGILHRIIKWLGIAADAASLTVYDPIEIAYHEAGPRETGYDELRVMCWVTVDGKVFKGQHTITRGSILESRRIARDIALREAYESGAITWSQMDNKR